MAVEHYSHVMHIVSAVSGRLREGVGAMDALRATLPAGTLSGAPKVRAMQIIDELEPVKRGGYGGAIGYLSYTGELDTAIHIRTVVVKDGVAHLQAGGGTVADARAGQRVPRVGLQGAGGAARDRARRAPGRLGVAPSQAGSPVALGAVGVAPPGGWGALVVQPARRAAAQLVERVHAADGRPEDVAGAQRVALAVGEDVDLAVSIT